MLRVRRHHCGRLVVLLVLSLVVGACVPDELVRPTTMEPPTSPPPTQVVAATSTLETPAATPIPSDVPPTPTSPPEPTPAPSVEPTASGPEKEPSVAIEAFSVVVEDAPNGKRLKFAWETTGASVVRIVSGTSQRFARWWEVEPVGTLVVDLETTSYRDPTMALMAVDEYGSQVIDSVRVEWSCGHDYFFEQAPIACPAGPATFTQAAEQAFQGGRAIWLQEAEDIGVSGEHAIIVVYNDGEWQRYDDTWAPGQPESELGVVPPEGLHQPTRGFGKLWRQSETIKERLGWALGQEQAFRSAWQWQVQESLPAVAYLRTLSGEVLKLYGSGSGNWEPVTQ